MNRIPPEILHKVFSLLDLDERLTCTLVSRSWWSVLDRYSLFYNIEIENDNDRFIRFIDMIERLPHRAAQVEELIINCPLKDIFNKRRLCNIFPNVRSIKLDDPITIENYYHFSEPIETTQQKSKVQHISDTIYCEYASQMMMSNLCDQLTTIYLDFRGLFVSCRTILPQMKNMPVLKELTLNLANLSKVDMEVLHNNIPSIQILKLLRLILCESEMPLNIISPTALTDVFISIEIADNIATHAEWYRYICSKYINVTKWDYNDEELFHTDETVFLYENGFLQFLEFIAPTQSSITLTRLPDHINFFKVLDNIGSQIEEFDIYFCKGDTVLQNFAESNQSRYVKDLTIDNTMIGSIHHFQNFTSLSKLTLEPTDFYHELTINLTDCLNLLPNTLKDFSIDYPDLVFEPVNCKPSSIENLTINSWSLTKELMEMVSSCFPQLVNLYLSGSTGCNLDISLPSHSLKSATFSLNMEDAHGFSFKCPNLVEPEYYLIDHNKNACVKYEDLKTKIILSVVSHTTKILDFSMRTIKLIS
ncbi:hypothetical protein K501DRAFT_315319 [Backusella circina FSU 941]|nr:hypothetical protein K501DRAFT_315319 [Backusella circina FSU 941]